MAHTYSSVIYDTSAKREFCPECVIFFLSVQSWDRIGLWKLKIDYSIGAGGTHCFDKSPCCQSYPLAKLLRDRKFFYILALQHDWKGLLSALSQRRAAFFRTCERQRFMTVFFLLPFRSSLADGPWVLGTGFVQYFKKDDADRCLAAANSNDGILLNDRKLVVCRAENPKQRRRTERLMSEKPKKDNRNLALLKEGSEYGRVLEAM